MQRQEILLKEVPFAEGLPDKWLTLPVKLDLLEELLETLFAVLMLDVDIQSSDLLNTADALDPEQQLGLLLLHQPADLLNDDLDLSGLFRHVKNWVVHVEHFIHPLCPIPL